MFDAICKYLVETFSADFAQWLLGEDISFSELSPSELLLEPIRADALLLQSEQRVLHLEFQTRPDAAIPFRLLDYWVRIHRRLPEREIRQVVIYLLETQSPLVEQTTFELAKTRHCFEVIRLWEQPTEPFLSLPGLLPFAPLSRTDSPEVALRQVARQIEGIAERSTQVNLAASAAILAGLVLEEGLIGQILGRRLMQESVVYQSIKAEGLEQGLQQGRQEGEITLIVRQLSRLVGTVPAELVARIESLPLEQLEMLGEALLDFEGQSDLVQWLETAS
ncbi:Rpn family recombination-promoting nuclease/putative transposase [Romeria aff. gracilis LEGE 07310]|uniref:Rpn family recombination-promoting nuclease/putative transposase n=1 Tax=Vasconcelosia minhoensis LEGE 07310 TaxID=915328 RepID=A0A8J7DNK5_9CYAN|nr:Rpn family recombination-promoting nuclease/putative transposase [Romeria gracilis]MBE9078245.1 Rpn family recombination-promoting nuclease/putative transposase [Romeria aff. gracilis LEGE 07310]